jgi:hypothetical protein
MGLFQFLWRQLPDRCGAPNCSRRGTRGNENVVIIGDYRFLMCQECTQIQLARRGLAQEYTDMHKRVIDAMNEDEGE